MEIEKEFTAENPFNLLLGRFLAASEKPSAATSPQHFDDDLIAGFLSGTLTRREAVPMVKHLTDCGLCRRMTAEMARLDLELDQETLSEEAPSESHAGISGFLESVFSRLGGFTGDAVFAHSQEDTPEETARRS